MNEESGLDLNYSDGIAAARTMLALKADSPALQRRLPEGWELAPYSGDDLRGTALRGANTLTEDPAAVPGKYRDGKLAHIKRSQIFTKEHRGETQVRETFSAVADSGEIDLSLAYEQGGMVIWATADKPNLPLHAAKDPNIVRVYQEDQVLNVVRSEPLNVNRVSEISFTVKGELSDVFDGTEHIVAVVIQRPYMRRVYVP